MAIWQLLNNEAAQKIWNEALLRLDDYTPFQTYAWGEYQRALGWEPCHWAAFNEHGEIVAMMLGLSRRYPLGVGLIWSEGGPVGDLSVCDESFQKAIKQTTGFKRVYCRFRCDRQRQVEDALRLNAQGWRRSWFNLTTSYSLRLDLAKEETQLLAGCERNWRRNLRRAWEGNLTVQRWTDPSVDEIVSAYDSMQCLKGLEEQHSREEFEHLIVHLKDQLVIYRGTNEQGQLVSLHGWLILGNRATAFLSATTEQGRQLHSSYAVIWALIQHCLLLHLQSCDLGGIDPVRNLGPYRFKKATGAAPIEYLGEWDWASRPWLQWFGNWAISRRHRLRMAESALKSSRRSVSSKPLFENPCSGAELSQPGMA
jgi:lipid II:glycine glycyltransferase (peptidoglycan interpeptide bridge formation enzyme)